MCFCVLLIFQDYFLNNCMLSTHRTLFNWQFITACYIKMINCVICINHTLKFSINNKNFNITKLILLILFAPLFVFNYNSSIFIWYLRKSYFWVCHPGEDGCWCSKFLALYPSASLVASFTKNLIFLIIFINQNKLKKNAIL